MSWGHRIGRCHLRTRERHLPAWVLTHWQMCMAHASRAKPTFLAFPLDGRCPQSFQMDLVFLAEVGRTLHKLRALRLAQGLGKADRLPLKEPMGALC